MIQVLIVRSQHVRKNVHAQMTIVQAKSVIVWVIPLAQKAKLVLCLVHVVTKLVHSNVQLQIRHQRLYQFSNASPLSVQVLIGVMQVPTVQRRHVRKNVPVLMPIVGVKSILVWLIPLVQKAKLVLWVVRVVTKLVNSSAQLQIRHQRLCQCSNASPRSVRASLSSLLMNGHLKIVVGVVIELGT